MTSKLSFVLIITCLFILNDCTNAMEELDGFYVIVKKITKCPDMGKDSIPYTIRMKKHNATNNVFVCNSTIPFDINNNIMISLAINSKEPNGKWSRLIERSSRACEFSTVMASQMKIVEGFNLDVKCPIPKGTQEVKEISDTYKINHSPLLPYGDYKIEVALNTHEGGKLIRQSCKLVYTKSMAKLN